MQDKKETTRQARLQPIHLNEKQEEEMKIKEE